MFASIINFIIPTSGEEQAGGRTLILGYKHSLNITSNLRIYISFLLKLHSRVYMIIFDISKIRSLEIPDIYGFSF